jgi:nitrogen fixation NifU-like protein
VYSEILIDHFRAPRNAGVMRDADAVGEWEDGQCGDLCRFYLRVEDGRVEEARFQTYGCGPSIAASSVATELVRGRTLDHVVELTADGVEGALGGLPADRRHAAELVVGALRTAVARYRARPGTEEHGV